jgi:hypothetical protein
MSYPTQAELKSKLKSVCGSEEFCELLATKFGGEAINCNHRIPQMAAVQAQNSTGASDSDVEKASQLLCSYVDTIACERKK